MLFIMFNVLMTTWKQNIYYLEIKDGREKDDVVKKQNRSDSEKPFTSIYGR